jgi:hypothetical protein
MESVPLWEYLVVYIGKITVAADQLVPTKIKLFYLTNWAEKDGR